MATFTGDTGIAGSTPTSEKTVGSPREDESASSSNKDSGESTSRTEDGPPKGGVRAWLCVLAAVFMFANAWGLTQAFGALEELYARTLLRSTSPSAISWIGSAQVFIVMALGAFTGPLFDAGYLRPLLVVGCFLIVLGMATLSLATTYWQVFLAQSLAAGIGSGLVFVPSLALVATLFPESIRPFAIGCVNSGGSFAGIIHTFTLRGLVPSVGLPWALRVMALTNLTFAVVALAILLPYHPPQAAHRRALFDLRALREPNFLLFSISLFLNYLSFYIPPFYVPIYATTALGQSRNFAFESLVIMSVGSLVGRTLPMLVATRLGSVQIYLAATVTTASLLFAWMAVHDVGGFLAFVLFCGISSGALIAAPTAAIAHPVLSPDMDFIGTRIGMLWVFGGSGVLVGAPVAGALVDVKPGQVDFRPAQAFAGAMVGGAALFLVAPLVSIVRYDNARKKP